MNLKSPCKQQQSVGEGEGGCRRATYMTSTFLQWGPLCVSFTSWMALGGMNLEWVAMHWHRSSVAILGRVLPVSRKGRLCFERWSYYPCIRYKASLLYFIFLIEILHLSKLPKSSQYQDQLLIYFRGADAQVHLKLNYDIFLKWSHIFHGYLYWPHFTVSCIILISGLTNCQLYRRQSPIFFIYRRLVHASMFVLFVLCSQLYTVCLRQYDHWVTNMRS